MTSCDDDFRVITADILCDLLGIFQVNGIFAHTDGKGADLLPQHQGADGAHQRGIQSAGEQEAQRSVGVQPLIHTGDQLVADGTAVFAKLDAEFAMIIYDHKTDSLIAARDPIGIRPLFYGYLDDGGIVFASEAKNLIGLCKEVCPFPPGHYYAEGKFVRYADLTTVTEYCHDDLETVCRTIRNKLGWPCSRGTCPCSRGWW